MTQGSTAVGNATTTLNGTATPFAHQVTIKAAHANTGQVYVGLASTVTANSNAATDGFELAAGESLSWGAAVVNDASAVYLIASASSQKVFWYCE